MSNTFARKLNLALYLNPETSESDRAAIQVLKDWYERARRSHPDRTILDLLVRLFHRDIYLAGLYLYQLSPQLSRSLAGALEGHQCTPDAFWRQLLAAGVVNADTTSATAEEARFSPSQMAQLQHLLAEQQGQLVAIQQELDQVRQLAERQARALQGLKRSGAVATSSNDADSEAPSTTPGIAEQELSELMVAPDQLRKVRQRGLF